MKNTILTTVFIFFFAFTLFSQKDYTEYYNAVYGNYRDGKIFQRTALEQLAYEKKAFRKIKRPPANHIFSHAYRLYINGYYKKGNKSLLKAARAGYEMTQADIEYDLPIIDSLFKADIKLKNRYYKNYNYFLRNVCDIKNSIKIIKLFAADQHVRLMFNEYATSDTLYRDFRWKEMVYYDSINYFSLIEILNTPNFNPFNLTDEAKLGILLILTHSATSRYVESDTVFAIMKDLVLKGVMEPTQFANAYDRYYKSTYGMNYYYQFPSRSLPVYDIENIDKRRAEMWLSPLYYGYKRRNQLDQLPEGYKYDIDTIGQ